MLNESFSFICTVGVASLDLDRIGNCQRGVVKKKLFDLTYAWKLHAINVNWYCCWGLKKVL